MRMRTVHGIVGSAVLLLLLQQFMFATLFGMRENMAIGWRNDVVYLLLYIHRDADCAVVKHSIRPEYVMNSTIHVAIFFLFAPFASVVLFSSASVLLLLFFFFFHLRYAPLSMLLLLSSCATQAIRKPPTDTLRTILIPFINFPCRNRRAHICISLYLYIHKIAATFCIELIFILLCVSVYVRPSKWPYVPCACHRSPHYLMLAVVVISVNDWCGASERARVWVCVWWMCHSFHTNQMNLFPVTRALKLTFNSNICSVRKTMRHLYSFVLPRDVTFNSISMREKKNMEMWRLPAMNGVKGWTERIYRIGRMSAWIKMANEIHDPIRSNRIQS